MAKPFISENAEVGTSHGGNMQTNERYIVPAVEQAFRMLFHMAFTGSSQFSLIKISSELDIHKSKAFSILQTLQKFGVVQRNSNRGGYSLGPGLIGLARSFLDNLNVLALAEPVLERLAGKIGSTAALGLIAGRSVIVVSKHEGGKGIAVTMRVGQHFPLTYGCHGKAIAAFMSKKSLDELLKEKRLYFQGDPSRFDRNKLMPDLERCRREWFAEDAEETAPGLNAVAAPVLGPNGYPIGYVVVLGLISRKATREHGPLVAEAGKILSRQLGARLD